MIESYSIKIYSGTTNEGSIFTEITGTDPNEHTGYSFEGFSRYVTIDFRRSWDRILAEKLCHYESVEETYESFVKFGRVSEWRKQYFLVFDVVYK